jgi:predicted Zn-dependent peptidase
VTDAYVITALPGGVRVVTERVPAVRSVALGFWIATGSSNETDEQAGLSHLLEHMLFRGTERYRSEEIDQIFDAMGAELNAGTGKESTSVYARVLDQHLERAFDVIAQMVWSPAMESLAEEREIVLEEIAMYEDDPQDLIFDILGETIFPDHPLGRATLGRAEVVSGATREQLADFHAARYAPANVVIAAAGNVEHDAIVEWATQAIPAGAGEPKLPPVAPPPPSPAAARFRVRDTEQYHLALGGPAIARDDERRFALRVLDSLLGGTSSSRLFQAVREQRGLAYSVFTFQSLYAHAGQIGLYVGTRPENVREVAEVIAAELARIRSEPVGAEELERAKDNVKGRVVLALESTGARMERLGGSLLAGMPILALDETIERIEAVDAGLVGELAAELLAPERLSAAAIGPDEDVFRAAIAPLQSELAEAS